LSEQEGKRKLGKGFWIILAVVVLVVMAGTAAGVYFLLAPNMAQERELPTYQVPLETFTVNLKDNNYRRFLRTYITVETSEKKVIKEMTEKQYKIKDTINSVLAAKNAGDLEDRDRLKEELIAAINSHLTEGEVVGLYFEQFIIQ
jgi:flagellar basal body-associated protein FliL